jgi:hypothetical protein
MKKLLGAAVTLLFTTALASAWQASPNIGGPPPATPGWGLGRGEPNPKREKPPEFRNLAGVVLDKADSPLKDAVVYLKNRKTKAMRTYIADADGAYRFPNLSRIDDYEIYAELKGQKSPVKTLSSFDSRVNAKLNLYIEPAVETKDEKAAGKKEVKKEEQTAKKEEKKDAPKIDDRVRLPDTPK